MFRRNLLLKSYEHFCTMLETVRKDLFGKTFITFEESRFFYND